MAEYEQFLAFHQPGKWLRTGGGDRQGQFIHGHTVSYSQTINATKRHLSCQQLPQQNSITVRQRESLEFKQDY